MATSALSYDSSANYVMAPDPTSTPVVPDATWFDLAGQFQSMPGGASTNGTSNIADGSGVNAVYTDPTANPTPTGGWMSVANSIAALAQQGMKTFSQGTPSPAIPAARRPLNTPSLLSFQTATGGTNWTVVGGVILIGVVGMVALAMWV
jgi:hypothetical protein